jgi:hypothetical protein
MTEDITATYDQLLAQTERTSNTDLLDAVNSIDKLFGEGFAKKNPALVATFIQTSSADFHHAMLKLAAQDIRDGLRSLAEAIGDDPPFISMSICGASLTRIIPGGFARASACID